MTTIVSIKNIDLDISFITYQIVDRGREFSKKQLHGRCRYHQRQGSYTCVLIARKIFTLMQNEKKNIYFLKTAMYLKTNFNNILCFESAKNLPYESRFL